MGTTRIKVIDLSSQEGEIKTNRKHAEKLAGVAKIKKGTEGTEDKEGIESIEELNLQKETVSKQPTDTTEPSQPSQPSQHSQPSQPSQQGKKYRSAKLLIENKTYTVKEAIELLPKTSFVKFDPSVEVHLNVSDKNIKGSVALPHLKAQKAKSKKYLVFSENSSDIPGEEIIFADEKTISKIEDGSLKPGKDFEIVITSAKFMPQLAKVAKVLGPKGMMPNPKNGTIVEDPKDYFQKSASNDQISYKSDPQAAVVHLKIGKLSQKPDEIQKNLRALVTAIGAQKIKKATLTTSMGPGIKIDSATA